MKTQKVKAVPTAPNISRLVLTTLAILSIPLIATVVFEEFNWSPFDFIFAFTLIFGTRLAYELIAKNSPDAVYRIAVGTTLVTSFLLVWVNGAVGLIGNEDNPINVLYFGVLALLAVGAKLTRMRPQGMTRVLYTTAAAQILVPIIAIATGNTQVDAAFAYLGLARVLGVNAFFASLWIAAAWLFESARSNNKASR